ncbi:aspartate kinase [Salegentibacter salarius]|uniref:Aspartokinase n=1 Tax=Salegentibacter salarius TaxID=435906 RepID=A0A2N0U2Y1_9FLAO|nr:aspartate kinase [Salegentibacter salarius]OEY71209.1 aspartate kinase [Salegentibacter salarius]PKD21363.1 aspartate kinase [Salegentibacter salarius]SLJ93033.1 aspartate kinase [Salegentibacter salarius]
MKVLKFGGTSVGSVESIRNVKNILASREGKKVLVLSAMAGVTNKLVVITELIKAEDHSAIAHIIAELKDKHENTIDALINEPDPNAQAKNFVNNVLNNLKEICKSNYSERVYAEVVTTGETMLTYIFSTFLTNSGIQNNFLDAKEFMQVSNLENPDTNLVGKLFQKSIENLEASEIYITQGFVRIDAQHSISTLKRGGSDYSATILAAAVQAEEVQIWTDIDGFHNNDPRYVENTHAIAELSFEEASELAYFGAKILHPQTISPVIKKQIPLFLKNTFTPDLPGTRISAEIHSRGLKAISAKDGITAIKIKSNRMLMAHGFLKKIFEVFDKYETAIDMITTSEIAISLTIDDDRNLNEILEELNDYGEITVEKEHSIICIVGEGLIEDKSTSRLFELLNDISVRMISYGGSNNNISLLVDTKNKVQTLQGLNRKLFEERIMPQFV